MAKKVTTNLTQLKRSISSNQRLNYYIHDIIVIIENYHKHIMSTKYVPPRGHQKLTSNYYIAILINSTREKSFATSRLIKIKARKKIII